jgi:hypothetical protein
MDRSSPRPCGYAVPSERLYAPCCSEGWQSRAGRSSRRDDGWCHLGSHLYVCPMYTLACLSYSSSAIALFIFGWTSPPAVMPGGGNWVGPVSSGIPFGFGMVTIYFSANAYIIDAFPGYVASALAAKTVIRSGSGAAMPLFITAMFHNLGNGWAASTWAFISLGMVSLSSLCFER